MLDRFHRFTLLPVCLSPYAARSKNTDTLSVLLSAEASELSTIPRKEQHSVNTALINLLIPQYCQFNNICVCGLRPSILRSVMMCLNNKPLLCWVTFVSMALSLSSPWLSCGSSRFSHFHTRFWPVYNSEFFSVYIYQEAKGCVNLFLSNVHLNDAHWVQNQMKINKLNSILFPSHKPINQDTFPPYNGAKDIIRFRCLHLCLP